MALKNPVLAPRPGDKPHTDPVPERRKQNTLASARGQKSGKVMEQLVTATEAYKQTQQQLEDTIRRLHLANSVLQCERDLLQEVVKTFKRVLESTGHRYLLIKVREQLQRTYKQQEQQEEEEDDEEERRMGGAQRPFLFDPKSPSPTPTIPLPEDRILEELQGGDREEGVGEKEGEGEGQDSSIAARLAIIPWDQLEKMDVEFPEDAGHRVASLLRLTADEFKAHRLYRELMLAGLQQPKTIPGVHPALFEVPQDPRIRAAPCAYLRARLILHRGKHDLDEVVRLLIDTSVAYGDPRHGNNWAISEEFVERFPYLTGPEARIALPEDRVAIPWRDPEP
ncbi:hypothetical protein BG006_003540 [Podila minutissima]|uniref:Uncharacterized protein n=1 Tax=Podila minutissima TaxID=64525 RepID=A0A9P5SX13_9FUNG|nr:hypothetical protein BG006_003540 [Podila minutissima]